MFQRLIFYSSGDFGSRGVSFGPVIVFASCHRAFFVFPFCCSKESRSLRVVRVELDDGQRLVGLRYPEQLIPEATLFLKEQKFLDAVIVSKY